MKRQQKRRKLMEEAGWRKGKREQVKRRYRRREEIEEVRLKEV